MKFAIMGILAVLVFGFVTMTLWNWLIPDILGAQAINFWQALGLLVLGRLLFGGFGGRGGHRGVYWKKRYGQKLSSMSPEERERFKARMKEKWCPSIKNTSNADPSTSID